MALLIPFLLLLTFHASSNSGAADVLEESKIRMNNGEHQYCSGWMLNIASNNIVGWTQPGVCQEYIKNLFAEGLYFVDFGIAAETAGDFLQTLEPTDGKDAVSFAVDDALLSQPPYHKNHSYGAEYDQTEFNEWASKGSAPALEPALDLYKKLQAQNWVLILMASRDESQRDILSKNLVTAGFTSWNELILKKPAEATIPASIFKATKRVELEKTKGYTFRSCIGSQWGDCAGPAVGSRTFKLPNSMYFSP